MAVWLIIMRIILTIVVVALCYLGIKVSNLLSSNLFAGWSEFRQFLLGLLMVLGATGIIALCIDFINAVICMMYLAMFWAISDFVFWLIQKLGHFTFGYYCAGWTALILTVIFLCIGWYMDHHVWQTNYTLATSKEIPELKIAMFADAHLGTTFDAAGFAKHLEKIQAQNPDVLVIVGDYVDDGTTKQEMVRSCQALGNVKTKYGIYFVSGNHDRGYYGARHRGFSEQELMDELIKNGITVLRDETILLADSFYLIGRQDASVEQEKRGVRKSMSQLTTPLDKNKYMIVLDHQPADYQNQAASAVDLVLSGHTHGGQLFPFNQVGKWIGANDLVYGYERRKQTDFIVTSGISDWAIRFKTGTKSEFVIVDIMHR